MTTLTMADILEQEKEFVEAQQAQLDAMITDSTTKRIFRSTMGLCLASFLSMSTDECKLLIKFLIESVERMEKQPTNKT